MALAPDSLTRLMSEAVELSTRHRPHPNPRVGAVVVDPSGLTVGWGSHTGPGTPHAEILALGEAGDRAVGGGLIVTLEPCNHHGRTPPCTDSIIAAGVTHVWVGASDPDGRVSGSGVARLRQAGIEVVVDTSVELVEASDPGYFHHRRTGRSRVIHKTALTLDGQTAAIDGTSQWITNDLARQDGHMLRASVDAVLVGVGTLISDDPLLNVRMAGYVGPQPRPVVVAGSRPLPADAAIWAREPLVIAPGVLQAPGEVIVAPGPAGSVDLVAALRALADRGLLDVLVEGGAGISGSLWEAHLIDAGVWYLAAGVAGGVGVGVFDRPFSTLGDVGAVEFTEVRQIGSDLRIDWRPI